MACALAVIASFDLVNSLLATRIKRRSLIVTLDSNNPNADFSVTYRNNFYKILTMTTKHRFRNKYRLQLREKDHEPMHAHLVGGEVNAKFDLAALALVAGSVPAGVLAEVTAWLQVNQAALIEEWKSWQV